MSGWMDEQIQPSDLTNFIIPHFSEPAKVKIIKHLIFSFCTDQMLLMNNISLYSVVCFSNSLYLKQNKTLAPFGKALVIYLLQ